jgi:hypothetical protein
MAKSLVQEFLQVKSLTNTATDDTLLYNAKPLALKSIRNKPSQKA